ncbi:MAG: tRNA adenosine(34) deaminase TadA [Firmicutes bacterium]|nr:tRNA adenosine(34) deaminase TadA [Bacillota bacterium]
MLTPQEQEYFMRECLKLCSEALEKSEVPVSALVIKDGEIIGKGINRRLLDSDPTAHAEVVALREAGNTLGRWNLSGCDLVVTLEPCAMCSGAIVNARIDNVYFGAYDTRFGYCGTLGNIASDERLNHRANVVGGILEEECLAPLKEFFKARRCK